MDEYLIDPTYLDIRDRQRPATPMEALMVADFGEDVEESAIEREARRQRLGALLDEAMSQLTPMEREIVEGCIIEQVPLRTLAMRISRTDGTHYGKTWIAHLRDQALAKLKEILSQAGLEGTETGMVDLMPTIEERKEIMTERVAELGSLGLPVDFTHTFLTYLVDWIFTEDPEGRALFDDGWLTRCEELLPAEVVDDARAAINKSKIVTPSDQLSGQLQAF